MHNDMTTSLIVIPNSPILVSGSLDSTVFTWDINTAKKQRELKGHINVT
jgi:WD40 repeat protein